jgi:hypothetical protein
VLGKEVIEADDADNVVDIVPTKIEPDHTSASNIVTIPPYPKGYIRGKNGGVYMRYLDKDGETVETCIYENDFYVVGRVRDPEMGACAVLRVHFKHDPMREFNIPYDSVSSMDELRKILSAQGFIIEPKQMAYIMH